MTKVVVQMGHVARRTGATGTHREQEFARLVGSRLSSELSKRGHKVYLIGADDAVPNCEVFVSLHLDGNRNTSIRGASVGYPSNSSGSPSGRLAQAWKRHHQRNGYPSGFHRDNYTEGLRYYYGFRSSIATFEYLAEHGTSTNPGDEAWLFSHIEECVRAHVDAIGEVVGHPILSPIQNGSAGGTVVNVAKRAQGGYALVGPDGGVFCEDGAPFFGSLPGIGVVPNLPVVGMAWTLDGGGYWLVSADGGVYAFGNAPSRGSYHSLDPVHKNDPSRRFIGIFARDDGRYTIVGTKQEKYDF